MRLACIGIGSNAIRLLTAEWRAEQLCVIRRERRGTRLFAGRRVTGDACGFVISRAMRSNPAGIASLPDCVSL